MERDIDLLRIVADFLISHGYPEESIILEWKIAARFRVDMAIIDNKSKKAIALFEFKRQKSKQAENMAIEQLKTYSRIIGDNTIPTYIVFGTEFSPYFELYFLTEENGNVVLKLIPQFPSFSNFRNNFISKSITKTAQDKKRTFNWFWFICWILALIIATLLFLDFKKCITITAERLGIIAIIVGLIIVPFARKLSILGLEFERLQEEKKD